MTVCHHDGASRCSAILDGLFQSLQSIFIKCSTNCFSKFRMNNSFHVEKQCQHDFHM
jgi:hypothetical protein